MEHDGFYGSELFSANARWSDFPWRDRWLALSQLTYLLSGRSEGTDGTEEDERD